MGRGEAAWGRQILAPTRDPAALRGRPPSHQTCESAALSLPSPCAAVSIPCAAVGPSLRSPPTARGECEGPGVKPERVNKQLRAALRVFRCSAELAPKTLKLHVFHDV